MISRRELLVHLNNSGIAQQLSDLKRTLLEQSMRAVGIEDHTSEKPTPQAQMSSMLNAVGPAAAYEAMDYAINYSRHHNKLPQGLSLNGNITHNIQQITKNLDVTGMDDFNGVLRQFLLPRYAYLDFDRVVDPRHLIDLECGYPKFITPIMYRYMYDRDDVARRVVDIYPDESWAVDPVVYDSDDEKETTPFEEAWQQLVDEKLILQYMYRMDRLSGIGHYGVLLLGLNDGLPLDQPLPWLDYNGNPNPDFKGPPAELLYMRPFDEYLSFIQMYENDVYSPRYGKAKYYNLVFLDMTIDAAGASIGTRLNRRVHWTRVIHIADNLQSSLVFGIPRMQPVFNRLLDLRKIKGGSAEMFWKGAFPGLAFEIDPQFVADDPEFDKDTFRKEIERYADGLQRYISLIGIKATSLTPQIKEPKQHVEVQEAAIAQNLNIPLKIFQGSEEGRLASQEDSLVWNRRLGKRYRHFLNPYVVRQVVDRFIALRILPPPRNGKYKVAWPDLNLVTDEDKANLALKWTQALSQYVATGIIHMIAPMDYMTMILGITPGDAKKIDDYIQSSGGYDKLKKVDPSTGAGVNGKRENIANPDEAKSKEGRKKKRNKADKQAEGMKNR